MNYKANGSVVFAELEIAFLRYCYDNGFCPDLWKFSSFHALLHILCIPCIAASPPYWISSPHTPSTPGAFLGFNFLMAASTSDVVISGSGSCCWFVHRSVSAELTGLMS